MGKGSPLFFTFFCSTERNEICYERHELMIYALPILFDIKRQKLIGLFELWGIELSK